jgi:hypothetical protein
MTLFLWKIKLTAPALLILICDIALYCISLLDGMDLRDASLHRRSGKSEKQTGRPTAMMDEQWLTANSSAAQE